MWSRTRPRCTGPRVARLQSGWLFVVLALVLLTAPVAAEQGRVTGWTVTWVEFGNDRQRRGEYRMESPGRWLEIVNGRQAVYQELRRDDGSVYLEDRQRGAALRLDLGAGQVYWRDRRGGWEPRYQLWGARADNRRFAAPAGPACYQAVQGRIDWDYQGTRDWHEDNLAQLCRGAERSVEPARCFQQAMHGGVSWGGGTRWDWNNALALCQGSRNASATLGCFRSSLDQGYAWEDAIEECSGGGY